MSTVTGIGGPPWNRRNIGLARDTVIQLKDGCKVTVTLEGKYWTYRFLPEGPYDVGRMAYQTDFWMDACAWMNKWEGRVERALTLEEKGEI